MKLVIDSHAWIDYFEGNASGEKARKYIEDKDNEIITNILNLSEISSFFERRGRNGKEAHKIILSNSKIYPIDTDLSKEAGVIHAEIRKRIKDFGLIDAFVLLTAKKTGAKVLTGDPHFSGFKEAILID